MPEVILQTPAEQDRAEVLAYRREFLRDGDSMDGTAGLRDAESYGEWLEKLSDNASEERLRPGFVPATLFLARDADSGELVGMIDVRHRLNDYLREAGGHIGYSVRRCARGRGYATRMLALALDACKQLGIFSVLVTCLDGNTASARVIEKNGGVLADVRSVEENGELQPLRRYWITLPSDGQ